HRAEALAAILRLPAGEAESWWHEGAALLGPARALAAIDEVLAVERPRFAWVLHGARAQALEALGRGREAFDEYTLLLTPDARGSVDAEMLPRALARVDV